MLSSPGGWIDNTPPYAFYYKGPVCKKVIIYCCYYLPWAIHLLSSQDKVLLLLPTLCFFFVVVFFYFVGRFVDCYFLVYHLLLPQSFTTTTIHLVELYFFGKYLYVVSLFACVGAQCLYICAPAPETPTRWNSRSPSCRPSSRKTHLTYAAPMESHQSSGNPRGWWE